MKVLAEWTLGPWEIKGAGMTRFWECDGVRSWAARVTLGIHGWKGEAKTPSTALLQLPLDRSPHDQNGNSGFGCVISAMTTTDKWLEELVAGESNDDS